MLTNCRQGNERTRPGKATAEYIDAVLTRITVGGALYVAAVVTLPTLLQARWNVPFYLGGTSLMIVVGVALDFAQQVESMQIDRQPIEKGAAGQEVAIKVDDVVHENDDVYLIVD